MNVYVIAKTTEPLPSALDIYDDRYYSSAQEAESALSDFGPIMRKQHGVYEATIKVVGELPEPTYIPDLSDPAPTGISCDSSGACSNGGSGCGNCGDTDSGADGDDF